MPALRLPPQVRGRARADKPSYHDAKPPAGAAPRGPVTTPVVQSVAVGAGRATDPIRRTRALVPSSPGLGLPRPVSPGSVSAGRISTGAGSTGTASTTWVPARAVSTGAMSAARYWPGGVGQGGVGQGGVGQGGLGQGGVGQGGVGQGGVGQNGVGRPIVDRRRPRQPEPPARGQRRARPRVPSGRQRARWPAGFASIPVVSWARRSPAPSRSPSGALDQSGTRVSRRPALMGSTTGPAVTPAITSASLAAAPGSSLARSVSAAPAGLPYATPGLPYATGVQRFVGSLAAGVPAPAIGPFPIHPKKTPNSRDGLSTNKSLGPAPTPSKRSNLVFQPPQNRPQPPVALPSGIAVLRSVSPPPAAATPARVDARHQGAQFSLAGQQPTTPMIGTARPAPAPGALSVSGRSPGAWDGLYAKNVRNGPQRFAGARPAYSIARTGGATSPRISGPGTRSTAASSGSSSTSPWSPGTRAPAPRAPAPRAPAPRAPAPRATAPEAPAPEAQ